MFISYLCRFIIGNTFRQPRYKAKHFDEHEEGLHKVLHTEADSIWSEEVTRHQAALLFTFAKLEKLANLRQLNMFLPVFVLLITETNTRVRKQEHDTLINSTLYLTKLI